MKTLIVHRANEPKVDLQLEDHFDQPWLKVVEQSHTDALNLLTWISEGIPSTTLYALATLLGLGEQDFARRVDQAVRLIEEETDDQSGN